MRIEKLTSLSSLNQLIIESCDLISQPSVQLKGKGSLEPVYLVMRPRFFQELLFLLQLLEHLLRHRLLGHRRLILILIKQFQSIDNLTQQILTSNHMAFIKLQSLFVSSQRQNLGRKQNPYRNILSILFTIITEQSMQNIIDLENQNSYSQYNGKREIKIAMCLNPNCTGRQRLFNVTCNELKITERHPEHVQCDGWVQTLEFLTNKNQKAKVNLPQQIDRLDFLLQPINSAYMMKTVSEGEWKKNMQNCYQNIKSMIDSQLIKSFQSCMQKMTPIIQNNANLVNNIAQLAQISLKNWTLSSHQLYQHKIKESLRQVNQLGLLRLRNCDTLIRQLQRVQEHIMKLESFIWQRQKQHEFAQRTQAWRVREQLKRVSEQTDIQIINQRIQMFIGSLKLNPIKSETVNNNISIKCPICNTATESTIVSTKAFKKAQCFSKFLKHLCFQHNHEIIQNYYNVNKKNIYKLSFEEFVREIQTTDAKKFLIIDRQNLRQKTMNCISGNNVYCLEIVSKNNENLPRGKYLAAESTGKDAADILIILAMYQISKLKNVKMSLLTKDHFGLTMKPIFSALGVNIQISQTLSQEMSE